MKLTNASTTLENAPEHMLALWERRIPSRQQPITLTAQRSITLKVLFKHVFLSKLTGWECFIDLIHHCNGYLSGKQSSLSDVEFFDWLIRPENCLNVMNGVYLEEKTKLVKAKNLITLFELSDKLSAAMAEEQRKLSTSTTNQLAQDETARRMLAIWAGAMSVDRTLSLSQKRKDALNFLFTEVFNSSLQKWEHFVDLLGGSEFLQTRFCKCGELFDWAITHRNCLRILNCVGTAEYITNELAQRLAANKEEKRARSINLSQNTKTHAESTLCESVLPLTNVWHELPSNRDHCSDERHFELAKNSYLWYGCLKVMKFMAEIKKPEVFTPQAFKSIS
jgi:hypothetical protein